jgi:peptidoglycan hydrolase-like protein with peptidoglycan-binding domain
MSNGQNVPVTLELPVLRQGEDVSPPAVTRLQTMLNFVRGEPALVEDGIFGPNTDAAVREFQADEHLVVDGIVGQNTWTALLTRYILFSQPG